MPTPNAAPDADAGRFASSLEALTGGGTVDRFGLAVSGGADSLAMLLLAERAFPGRIEAATVDHGLRPAAAEEAAFVASVCGANGIPHAILTLDPLPRGNVQAAARAARYAALTTWRVSRGLDWLLTAHHADDQLETIVMRLNRGAGVGGLAGIRAVNGRVVRPLLGWRRSALRAIVDVAGLAPVEDPSNLDERYDRARLRKALAGAPWLDPLAAGRSAAALAQADAALDWAAGALDTAPWDTLPDALLRRRLAARIAAVDPAARPDGPALDRLIVTLRRGGSATIGGVLCRGDPHWAFTHAPPRRVPTR